MHGPLIRIFLLFPGRDPALRHVPGRKAVFVLPVLRLCPADRQKDDFLYL
jgi:hypothetical protein